MAVIRGTPGADRLGSATEGDEVFGLGGDDTLSGGDGVLLDGGTGNDSFEGGGSVVIRDPSGDSTIFLYAATAGGSITTGTGDDVIAVLYSELDFITTGAGDDRLGGYNSDYGPVGRIDLGPGNDYAVGGYGGDRISGGPGDDDVQGGPGDDVIDGGGGDDTLGGAGGLFDAVRFGDGADTLIGNAGNDRLFGTGNGGVDTLLGGAGDDFIDTGFGNRASGGPGDDFIEGGGTLSGDGGADTFFYVSYWLDEYDDLNNSVYLYHTGPDTILDFRPVLETTTVETDEGPLDVSTFGAGGDAIDLEIVQNVVPGNALEDLVTTDPATGAADLNWRDYLTLERGTFQGGNNLLISVPGGGRDSSDVAYLKHAPSDLDALGEALLVAGANIDLSGAA